jgi:hypothetical protein
MMLLPLSICISIILSPFIIGSVHATGVGKEIADEASQPASSQQPRRQSLQQPASRQNMSSQYPPIMASLPQPPQPRPFQMFGSPNRCIIFFLLKIPIIF